MRRHLIQSLSVLTNGRATPTFSAKICDRVVFNARCHPLQREEFLNRFVSSQSAHSPIAVVDTHTSNHGRLNPPLATLLANTYATTRSDGWVKAAAIRPEEATTTTDSPYLGFYAPSTGLASVIGVLNPAPRGAGSNFGAHVRGGAAQRTPSGGFKNGGSEGHCR